MADHKCPSSDCFSTHMAGVMAFWIPIPNECLKLGDVIEPYGKLGMIQTIDGERYYFFEDKHGSVAMIDAWSIHNQSKP